MSASHNVPACQISEVQHETGGNRKDNKKNRNERQVSIYIISAFVQAVSNQIIQFQLQFISKSNIFE